MRLCSLWTPPTRLGWACRSIDAGTGAAERYGIKDLTGKYAEVVHAMGGYSERIEKTVEIIPAIRRAEGIVAEGQPALREIITEREHAFSYRLR